MLATHAERERFAAVDMVERQLVAELREVARQKAAIEAVWTGRARARAATTAAASTKLYRDGSPKALPGHREVARRYAWAARPSGAEQSPVPGSPAHNRRLTLVRLRELERLFSARYGAELPDDDAGRDDFKIVAHHIVHLGPDAERHIIAWAALWCPWLSNAEATATAIRSIANPIKFTADVLAWRLRLTAAERKHLAITTIGAIDQNKAQRAEAQKQRRREAERARRRARGAKARVDYELSSAAAWRPWEAEGISRATWYRRRKAAASGGSVGERELAPQSCPTAGGAGAADHKEVYSNPVVRQVRATQVSESHIGMHGGVSPSPCGPPHAPAIAGAPGVSSGEVLSRMRGATAPPVPVETEPVMTDAPRPEIGAATSHILPKLITSSHSTTIRADMAAASDVIMSPAAAGGGGESLRLPGPQTGLAPIRRFFSLQHRIFENGEELITMKDDFQEASQ